MNTNQACSASPDTIIKSFWMNRSLIKQMTWREISSRYKGSVFGLGWAFFNPLLMLAVYTFVFSVVFKARWGINNEVESKTDFALILFVGLIIHLLFSEVLNRSPALILNHTNYVKKIVFPLEILSIVCLGSAFFHALISFCILAFACLILNGNLDWTVILLPFTLFPLLPVTLGLGWILASLGIYIRDIGHVINAITMMFLFFAPVFYPLTALPKSYQFILLLNPITIPIEQTRAVVMYGQIPDWTALSIYSLISLLVCFIGFYWFQKLRHGFADVI